MRIFHVHGAIGHLGIVLAPSLLHVGFELSQRLGEFALQLLQAGFDDLGIGCHRLIQAALVDGLAVGDALYILADDFRGRAARTEARGRDDDDTPGQNADPHAATSKDLGTEF